MDRKGLSTVETKRLIQSQPHSGAGDRPGWGKSLNKGAGVGSPPPPPSSVKGCLEQANKVKLRVQGEGTGGQAMQGFVDCGKEFESTLQWEAMEAFY